MYRSVKSDIFVMIKEKLDNERIEQSSLSLKRPWFYKTDEIKFCHKMHHIKTILLKI